MILPVQRFRDESLKLDSVATSWLHMESGNAWRSLTWGRSLPNSVRMRRHLYLRNCAGRSSEVPSVGSGHCGEVGLVVEEDPGLSGY
jgi:hypothetical protein